MIRLGSKILGFLFATLVVFFWCSNPQPAHAGLILQAPNYLGLSNGLVGYWSFNSPDMAGNTAYDRSGQGNNGTLTNGPVRTIGKIGQALNFDGVNDYINVGTLPNLTISQGTGASMSAWFKTTNTSRQYIMGNNGTNINTWGGIDLGLTGTGHIRTVLFQNLSQSKYIDASVLTDTHYYDGAWHHIVVNVGPASNTVSIYLDGILLPITYGSQTIDSDISFSHNMYIGALENVPNSSPILFFNGKIDDVRIYNRALSADEIQRLYRIGATLRLNKPNYSGSLNAGLVGYWSFDAQDMAKGGATETAYDRSGQGNNGTLTNGPVRTIGKIGQALQFDGANSYISVPDTNSLKPSAVTVSAWVKFNSLTPTTSCGGASPGEYLVFKRNSRTGSFEGYTLVKEPDNAIGFDITSIGGNQDSAGSISKVTTGVWYHIVGTFSRPNIRFYLNGVLTNNSTHDFDLDYGSRPLFIGRSGECGGAGEGTFDAYFNGSIDDVRIYNRALSTDEIQRLYRIGATLKLNVTPPAAKGSSLTNGLVGYWSFDGADMAQSPNNIFALDRSGQGNNGKLKNMATTSAKAPGKIGQALNFDGVNDRVNATMSTQFSGSFSVSAWVYMTGLNETQGAITSEVASYSNYWWFLGIAGFNRIGFDLYDGTHNPVAEFVSPTFNTWHHVVGIRNIADDTLKFYMDGVLEQSVVDTTTLIPTYSDFNIGGQVNVADRFFSGSIDDVRIYNRALTRDEIKRLYNIGRPQ